MSENDEFEGMPVTEEEWQEWEADCLDYTTERWLEEVEGAY